MKKIIINALLIIFAFSATAKAALPKSPMTLTIKTQNGEIFDLSKERGKLVVVTFWVSWCNICREELEELNLLYKNNNLQNGQKKNFEVIAINFDEQDDDNDARKFLKILNPSYKIARFRDIKTNNFPRVTALPATYIINEKGSIREEFEIEDIDDIGKNLEKALR